MLQDEHLKVLYHEQESNNIFANTDIKGGIAITYHDKTQHFGAIGVYAPFPELNTIKQKVWANGGENISSIVFNRGLYRFSPKAYEECPDELAKNTDSRIGASSFTRMPAMFTEEIPDDGYEYVKVYGLLGRGRAFRWMRSDYVKLVESFYKYKVLVPAANGSGALGETLSNPVIGVPLLAHTETFLTIGGFETEAEAKSCLKYIKTKFARVLLGILKITQHNSPEKWRFVPLQDFTPDSDIDWSKSVADIDQQLYKKYDLSQEEVDFIETHVKEMV